MPLALSARDSGSALMINKGGNEESGKKGNGGEEGSGGGGGEGEEGDDLNAVQDLSVPKREVLKAHVPTKQHNSDHFDGKSEEIQGQSHLHVAVFPNFLIS